MRRHLALVLAVAACGPGAAPDPVPARYRGAQPALTRSPAIAYLPRDTVLVAVAGNPGALDRQLAWTALGPLLADHPLGALAGDAAVDGLERAGLAPDRPAGVALMAAPKPVWVAFATVADRARAIAALERLAGGDPLVRSVAGDGEVFLAGGHAAVLRGDQLLVLATEHGASIRELAAVRTASLDRTDSLADQPGYRTLVDRLRFGADLALYADLPALLPGTERDRVEAYLAYAAERLSAQIAAARKAGDEAAANAAAAQLEAVEQTLDRATRSRTARADLIRDLGPVAVGLQVEAARARVAAVSVPTPGSVTDRLVTGEPAPGEVVAALPAPVRLALAGHADPAALLAIADGWLAGQGSGLAELRASAEAASIDLDRGLTDNLTGHYGVIAAGDPDAPVTSIYVRIRDRDQARALLAGLAGSDSLSQRAHPIEGGVRLETGGPPILLVQVGGGLLATTDPAQPARFAGPSSAADSPLVARLAAALIATPAPPPEPPVQTVQLRPDDHPAPLSPAYRAAHQRWQEAAAAHRQASAAARDRAVAEGRAAAAALGRLALEARRVDGALVGFGDLDPPDGVAAAVSRFATGIARAAAVAEVDDGEVREAKRAADAQRAVDIAAWERANRNVGDSPTPAAP